MERFEMSMLITDKVIEGLKAVGEMGSRRERDNIKKETHKRLDIMISLEKGASDENLKDMIGFIEFSERHKNTHSFLLENLFHDINGLVDNDPGFSPRTNGYSTVTV